MKSDSPKILISNDSRGFGETWKVVGCFLFFITVILAHKGLARSLGNRYVT
jgi:hypothetical protein